MSITDKTDAHAAERELFHAWCKSYGIDCTLWIPDRPSAGYANHRTQDIWTGWLQKANSTYITTDEDNEVKDNVNSCMELADKYVVEATGDTATGRHKYSAARAELKKKLELLLGWKDMSQGAAALALVLKIRHSKDRHIMPRDWLLAADEVLGTWGPVKLTHPELKGEHPPGDEQVTQQKVLTVLEGLNALFEDYAEEGVPDLSADSSKMKEGPTQSTQQKVLSVLAGIDQTGAQSDVGWWGTSEDAKFGAEKLAEIQRILGGDKK
jgi:hypothetical protein